MAAGSGDDTDQTTVMYFLDVLSSGLGASILLFLVFSVLPHFGDVGGGQSSRDASDADGEVSAIGAAADPMDGLARTAVVTLRVTVVADQGSAPTPESGRWEGLPDRPGSISPGVERVKDKPAQITFVAISSRGVPTGRAIRFGLTPAAEKDFTAVVIVTVGGFVQRKEVRFARQPSGEWTRTTGDKALKIPALSPRAGEVFPVVVFDLGQKDDWIRLP